MCRQHIQRLPLTVCIRGCVGVGRDGFSMLMHSIYTSLVYIRLLLYYIVILHPARRFPNPIFMPVVPKVPNIQHSAINVFASSNTPPSFERDLPYVRYPSQQIPNHSPVPYVPHLQSPSRTTQHLELIML